MAGQALTVKIRITGLREALAAFRRLPKDASEDLRRRTLELSTMLAGRVAAAGAADSPQSALIAPTVKARRDRVPVIVAGGATRVGSRRVPAWKILFGSEFGSRTLGQYRPHLGRGSYWIWRTVEANQGEIASTWHQVAADIERSFTRNGG